MAGWDGDMFIISCTAGPIVRTAVNGCAHNTLEHYYLMLISCHFRYSALLCLISSSKQSMPSFFQYRVFPSATKLSPDCDHFYPTILICRLYGPKSPGSRTSGPVAADSAD